MVALSVHTVAANVQGLAMLGHLRFFTPELKLNIVTIVD
jgi:hypothetical protein